MEPFRSAEDLVVSTTFYRGLSFDYTEYVILSRILVVRRNQFYYTVNVISADHLLRSSCLIILYI